MKGPLGWFFAVVVVLLLLPFVFTGLGTARSVEYVQTIPNVTTVSPATSADVTLIKSLLDDELTSVVSIASDNENDVAAPTAYTTGTRVLEISGLETDASRALYITFNYARSSGADDTLWRVMPLFLALAVLVLVILNVWQSSRR